MLVAPFLATKFRASKVHALPGTQFAEALTSANRVARQGVGRTRRRIADLKLWREPGVLEDVEVQGVNDGERVSRNKKRNDSVSVTMILSLFDRREGRN